MADEIPSSWTVGKTAVVGLSIIALLGAGIYLERTYCWSATCRTIKAGKITLPRWDVDGMVGHYKMVAAGPGTLEMTDTGGACVAWKSTANQNCTQDRDCRLPAQMVEKVVAGPAPGMSKQVPWPQFAGAYAYCAPQGGSPQKTCWIKVKFNHCRKSPPSLVLNEDNETNPVDLLLVRAALYGLGKGPAHIQGRVVACLNGPHSSDPNVKTPCGGGPGQSIHDWSNPQPISVPAGAPLCPPGQEERC